jgi:hypothetical protein
VHRQYGFGWNNFIIGHTDKVFHRVPADCFKRLAYRGQRGLVKDERKVPSKPITFISSGIRRPNSMTEANTEAAIISLVQKTPSQQGFFSRISLINLPSLN